MNTKKNNRTVAVGMSGGVDSSVAAALLIQQGYDVVGLTMKTYDSLEVGGGSHEGSCCDLQGVKDAHTIAEQLGIPHYVVNYRDEFNAIVIKNFIDEYMKGRTPNPCVVCNREIKWGVLLKKAEELGAQYIATGHYARVRYDEIRKRYILSRGKHKEKDQSYALWAIQQSALERTLFPLGGLTKQEVRALAEEYKFKNAQKPESFEICFVPDDRYDRFLKERIPDLEKNVSGGDIVYHGQVVGKHNGYPFYTIGQRRSIGAHKQKMYVTAINSTDNIIQIGPDSDLHHRILIGDQVNWISRVGLEGSVRVQAKVRYKDDGTNALISMEEAGKIRVTFDQPKRAITPGQSVVVYEGDDLLCGAIIEQALD